MARLTTCCVCWKLATGVVATGITCIIFNLLVAAFCGWRLSHLAEEFSHVNRIQNLFTADGLANLFNEDDATSSGRDNGLGKLFGSIGSGATKDVDAQISAAYNRTYAILCVFIALQVISILFNLSLIYAARQKRHRLLLPWLVWYCLFTGLHVIFGLYMVVAGDPWLQFVIVMGPAIFYIYLILVVVSYYLTLRDAAACGEQPLPAEQQPMQPLPEPLPPSQLGGGQVKQPYAPPAQYAPGGQPYAPPAQYAPGGQPYAPPPQAGQPPPQYSSLSPAQMGGGQVKQ